jgi:peptidoglycan/LPS O-acetylase OafA/YrhL
MSTRERGGYFKVFYFRRAVRVLPLYYLTIAVVGVIMLFRHWVPNKSLFLYLIYLQNFSNVAMDNRFFPRGIGITHLWSMAVEEQFYLLWPVVIWFLRTEKNLLRFIWGTIAACFAIRFAWPLTHEPANFAYFSTLTRGDAIMLGAWLAVEYRRQKYWDLLVRFSRIAAPALWALAVVIVLVRKHALSGAGYFEVVTLIPLMNTIGLGFVVLAIEPTGWVRRICSGQTICRLGRMSYSLYLFHGIYSLWFTHSLLGRLQGYLPYGLADTLMICLGFLFTLGLAMLAYRFIEEPGMRLKDKFPYTKRETSTVLSTPELATPRFESVGSSS